MPLVTKDSSPPVEQAVLQNLAYLVIVRLWRNESRYLTPTYLSGLQALILTQN